MPEKDGNSQNHASRSSMPNMAGARNSCSSGCASRKSCPGSRSHVARSPVYTTLSANSNSRTMDMYLSRQTAPEPESHRKRIQRGHGPIRSHRCPHEHARQRPGACHGPALHGIAPCPLTATHHGADGRPALTARQPARSPFLYLAAHGNAPRCATMPLSDQAHCRMTPSPRTATPLPHDTRSSRPPLRPPSTQAHFCAASIRSCRSGIPELVGYEQQLPRRPLP